VRDAFEQWDFASMVKQPYWDRFVKTFDPLFACQE